MKTTMSSSPETKSNSGIGSTRSQAVSKQILGIMSMYDQGRVTENKNTLLALLEDLQTVVERKQEELGYDYEDYETRLAVNDEVLEEVFRKEVLGDEKLRSMYENLLGSIEESETRKIFKQRLWDEYFDDLVYASIDHHQTKGKILDLSNGKLKTRLGDNETEFLEEIRNTNSIHLGENYLNQLEEEKLKIIFDNLKNIKSINLKRNNLFELDEARLKVIFENLKMVKHIDLRGNDLDKLDEVRLKTIFENLKMVKSIDLGWNDWDKLDEVRLKIVFENLKMVKSIDLGRNDLGKLDEVSLKIIFENITKITDIGLGEIYLYKFDEAKLKIIFENLKNLKVIDLRRNHLNKLDEPRLKMIFGNLGNAQKIYLIEPPEFLETLFLLFPNLKGKIINKVGNQ